MILNTNCQNNEFWKNEEDKCDFDEEIEEGESTIKSSSTVSSDDWNFTQKMLSFYSKKRYNVRCSKNADSFSSKWTQNNMLILDSQFRDVNLEELSSKH